MKKSAQFALHISAIILSASTAMAANDGWHNDVEDGLSKLLEEIRAEDVSTGACGAPPRGPAEVSDRASKRFYNDTQSWDSCMRDRLDKLEARVIDYQYQLDNWLPELPRNHPLANRAARTIEVYNRRVGSARERAGRDYKALAKAEADYADRIDTANRQAAWAKIEEDGRISQDCSMQTSLHFSATSETIYECIERVKYERRMIAAGLSPYEPYGHHHDDGDYERVEITVNVSVDNNDHH